MVQFIKFLAVVVWKLWIFFCLFWVTILLTPILIFVSFTERTYWLFFFIARIWAKVLLCLGGFYIKTQGDLDNASTSKILIANHTSPLDILLMLTLSKRPLIFIGKSSLAKIPIFGFFYKKTSILVDRADADSRSNAFKQATQRLQKGLDICVFPEGGVPEDESIILDSFKKGAFRLSVDFQIPIVPIAFLDCKKKMPYRFLGGGTGALRCIIHTCVKPKSTDIQQVNYLKDICYQKLYNDLQNQ